MMALKCFKSIAQSKVFAIACSWLAFISVYVVCFYISILNTENKRPRSYYRFNTSEIQLISSLLSGKRDILDRRENKDTHDDRSDVRNLINEYSSSSYYPNTKTHENEIDISDNINNSVSPMNMKQNSNFRERFKNVYNEFSLNFGKENVENGDEYLIYRCDSKWMSHCGGWADRIKGVIAGYLLANLTGRTFKAEIKSRGCDMLDYVVPNLVNWGLPRSFHESVHQRDDVKILNVVDKMDFYNSVGETNFQTLPAMKSKYVYFKANLDFTDGLKSNPVHAHQLSWMANATRDKVAGNIFRRLFKLSPPLRKRLDDFLERSLSDSSEKLVCAHIRMGRNPSIPHDTAIRNNPDVLPKVWDFIKRISSRYNRSKVFVMSDSEDTISDAKRQEFLRGRLVLIPGRIVHIEKSAGEVVEDVCELQSKVVLEQFVLMHCDVLMISKSGLSRMAAYVRGSDEGLFCLVSGEVIPCRLSQLKEVYKIRG